MLTSLGLTCADTAMNGAWVCGVREGTWDWVVARVGSWACVIARPNLLVVHGSACNAGWSWFGLFYFLFFIFFSKLCNLSICAFSFGKAMDRNIGFEIFWCCGSDGNNLLLKVGTRWRQGQQKDSGEGHRCQKIRALALIPC